VSSDSGSELSTIWDEAKGHIEQGNYDKATEIYRYILVRYSDNDTAVEYANAYLGDVFLTLRQLDLAEDHTKRAIRCNPEKPGYHYILGFTYSIECKWAEAIREFEVAVDREPNNGEYLRGLGWAVYSSGDKVRGLAYLHKAIGLSPANENILTDLAFAYLSLGDIDKAREHGEEAAQINPASAIAQELIRKIDLLQKQYGRPSSN